MEEIMKLIRGLVASVLLTGLVVAAAPAQAAHRHSRSYGHRAYYSHSYRPYDYGYLAYEPYPYSYSYRPVRYYSRGYYVAPRRVLVPRARLRVRPYVDFRLGF
jgi:hypothetical protein